MTKAFTEDPGENVGVSRRALVAGLLALPAIAPAQAAIDPYERVKRDADALAASMQALHGGTWGIRINHDRAYAAVTRDL